MSKLDCRDKTDKQYSSTQNLDIRRKFHEKYNDSGPGYDEWVYNLLQISKEDVILEVGSGTGELWKNHIGPNEFQHLIVSDISDAMIKELSVIMKNLSNVSVRKIDVCDMDFAEESFSKVIANSMIYHVKEISIAVSQIYRILKWEGKFFATTTSNKGLYSFLCNTLNNFQPNTLDYNEILFSLEEGEKYLSMFNKIEKVIVEKKMEITDVEDIVSYIYTMDNIIDINKLSRKELIAYYRGLCNHDGKIIVPKCYGMFICTK